MAIVSQGKFTDYSDLPFHDTDVTLKFEEYAVAGKMLEANYYCNESEILQFGSDAKFHTFVKDKLAVELARAMINNKLVEFTLTKDHANNTTLYRARCFATPDETVKILRSIKHKR